MWDQLISIVETGNMEKRRIGNITKTAPLGNNKAKKILLSYLSSLSHFEGLFTGDDETKKHKGTKTLAQCSTSEKILGPAGPQVFIFGHQNKYSGRQKLYLRINGIQ